jgi:uncharacterized glyoxalase superfamily protein PhnB
LYYEDVAAAIDQLTKSFGFQVRNAIHTLEGSIIGAELQLGKGVVIVAPGMEAFGTIRLRDPDNVSSMVYVHVDDIDRHFAHSKATGVTLRTEIFEHGRQGRMYTASDREGQRWTFVQAP